MTKASSYQWRYLLRLLQELPPLDNPVALKNKVLGQFPRRFPRRWLGSGGWLLASTVIVTLFYWDSRLVLSTGTGLGVMVLIYLLHDWRPKLPLADLRQFLTGWNQPLALAATGGAIAVLTTYLATSIWLESDSHWIASGAILQGMGTVAVLLLLTWQIFQRQAMRDQVNFNQLLMELTHDDPLRRLIAVRQLSSTVTELDDRHPQRRELADCFRLMLSREKEAIVREAVLEGFEKLDTTPSLRQSRQPVVDPEAMKRRRRGRSPQPEPLERPYRTPRNRSSGRGTY